MKTIKHLENKFKGIALLFGLLIFSILLSNAENTEIKKGTISGKVVENNKNTPLQYAQLALFSKTDSSLVTGTISKEDGRFILNKIPEGNYYLVAEYIGFQQQTFGDIKINKDASIVDLEEIKLNELTTEIDEVNVVAQKRNSTIRADKKVLNVDKNLSATGGTAIDALKISPSITVNQEGNVLLRGSSSFKVLVDGKPSALKPNEALKQMPSS
jgi:hypothetical protein